MYLFSNKLYEVVIKRKLQHSVGITKFMASLGQLKTARSIVNVRQGSEYASVSDFEYISVLNMPRLHRVLNMPE